MGKLLSHALIINALPVLSMAIEINRCRYAGNGYQSVDKSFRHSSRSDKRRLNSPWIKLPPELLQFGRPSGLLDSKLQPSFILPWLISLTDCDLQVLGQPRFHAWLVKASKVDCGTGWVMHFASWVCISSIIFSSATLHSSPVHRSPTTTFRGGLTALVMPAQTVGTPPASLSAYATYSTPSHLRRKSCKCGLAPSTAAPPTIK